MNDVPKRVLVTGSSGSLGAFIASRLLEDGYEVTGLDLATPTAPPFAGDSGSAPSRWYFKQCDLSNPEAVKCVLGDGQLGLFDVVVNNLGLIHSSPLVSFHEGKLLVHDFETWNKVLSVTLSATFYVTALCARQSISAAKRSIIVNISSVCAAGNPGQGAYSAAKAGVNGLTAALAKELGPLGIRVAAIAPGFFDTASTHHAMSEEAVARMRKVIPLRKLGSPEQFYHALRFVMENDYFHGRVLELDGGLTL